MIKYNSIKANNLKEILRTILQIKKMTKEEMLDFVQFKTPLIDPFLLNNMDKAIERLQQAIFDQQSICIIGDYDVDGLTATTIMYKTLIKFMPTHYLIPNRLTDGYGISRELVDRAKELNTRLLITVDNGIAGQEAIEYAHSLNMEVIITDHHPNEGDYFPAEITINPQIDGYPFKGICGCMVAYKLCTTLLKSLKIPYNDKEFIELTTLATLADMMPIINENRTIVHKGLKYLNNSDNIGIKKLIEKLKLKDIDTTKVGFFIAPCLNAAGRMESSDLVMDLFLAETEKIAEERASYLIELNNKRKKLQDEIMKNMIVDDNHNIIIAHVPTDISGIAGIIAAKIKEKYNKPVFAVGGVSTLSGSGRSNEFPINQIIEKNDFIQGGGHAQACGIRFKKEDLNKVQEVADKMFEEYSEPIYEVDVIEIDFNIINDRLVETINSMQPFGKGNENPLFITKDVEVINKKVVGKNKNVTQFQLRKNWCTYKGILFNINDIKEGDTVDIIYTLEFNEFPTGVFNIQLNIKAFL